MLLMFFRKIAVENKHMYRMAGNSRSAVNRPDRGSLSDGRLMSILEIGTSSRFSGSGLNVQEMPAVLIS